MREVFCCCYFTFSQGWLPSKNKYYILSSTFNVPNLTKFCLEKKDVPFLKFDALEQLIFPLYFISFAVILAKVALHEDTEVRNY